jgi:hypothetical protein
MTPNHRLVLLGSFLALMVRATAASPSAAAPLGQLLNVHGRVTVKRGPSSQAGTSLTPVRAGDRLSVAAGSSAEVVLYRPGKRYRLSSGAAVTVESAGLRARSGAAPRELKFVAQPLPPLSAATSQLGLVIRTLDERPVRLLTPRGGLLQSPVVLTWQHDSATKKLLLRLRDGRGEVIHKREFAEREQSYALPDGLLRPGEVYQWSVIGFGDGGEATGGDTAVLRVLLPGEAQALERLERLAEEELAASPPDPTLLLALAHACERYWLLEQAEAAYDRAARLVPTDEAVRKALARLRAAR